MKTKITACRMPIELRQWLDADAKKEGRSTANMIIWIIDQYRKKNTSPLLDANFVLDEDSKPSR